jgi:hypothetical protein
MRSFLIFILLFFGFANPSFAEFANNKPIWEQINKLICRGEYSFECVSGSCKKGVSTAIWEIDFLENRVKYLNVESTEEIREKYFKYYGPELGSKNVIFLHGRLMDFDLDNYVVTRPSRKMRASVLGFTWEKLKTIFPMQTESNEIRFNCFPKVQ